MSDIPEGERPRERFKQIGASGASQRELLAIVLGSGPRGVGVLALADELLHRFGGLPGLARASLEDLQRVQGIGEVKAIEIKAALELGKRLARATPEQKPMINSPADAAEILMLEMGLLEQEEIHTMLLDIRNRVIGTPMIYRGSLHAATLRVGEIFKEAVRANSAHIILAHNHPSGDVSPSAEDIQVTQVLVQAGKMFDIEVQDHLIIAQGRYVSLRERGLGGFD